jgi:anti-sigma regulatory factor (Ser/Thr protein kinase)
MKLYSNFDATDLSLENVSSIWTDDVTHVIYTGNFDDVLREWTPDKEVHHLVSLKNYQQDGDLHGKCEVTNFLLELKFCHETVSQVSDRIREALQVYQGEDYFQDLKRYLVLVGTELVQNALIYQRINNEVNDIELTLSEGEGHLKICVTDPYGALKLNHILSKLKRCIIEATVEEKKEGAGFGLYMVANSCDKMIINVKKNQRTQFCCIINKYKRLKDFKHKGLSLHYIKEDA